MNDTARTALSSILFADADTPLDTLIQRCRANPVHLEGAAAETLCSAQGPLALWPEKDGCTLLSADLHALVRDAGLADDGLILHLPTTIDGSSLVRIAADAFRPWLSYGVGLRAIVLPEGMVETSDRALSPLCFEHAALPSTLQRFGKRPVQWSKLTRYPDRVRYSVHPDNRHFLAEDGSLYSKDGETLIAQAYPYGECVRLRDGVRHIRDDAFLHTPHPPKRIICPDSLRSAPDAIDSSLLWIADAADAFAQTLRDEGRRTVSPAYRVIDEDVFDFDDEGAFLVMTADGKTSVALPDAIESAALVRIGRRALPLHADSVVLGSNVHTVEDGNACEGARRIVLCDALERIGRGCFMHASEKSPIRIPRSVQSIEERSFSGSRIFIEALDTTAFIPSGMRAVFDPQRYREKHDGTIEVAEEGRDAADAFTVPFDIRAYDELLESERLFLAKTEAIVDRLAGKVEVDKTAAKAFAEQLGKNAEAACSLIAEKRSRRAVERLAQAGFYDENERFLAQCERLRKAHAAEALGALIRLHERSRPVLEKPSDRFAF